MGLSTAERSRRYRAKNRDACNERTRQWRERTNYYGENKESILVRCKEYQQKHPEAHRKAGRNYNRRNREHLMEYKRGKRYGLLPGQFEEMRERQSNLCVICKEDLRPGKATHIDHDHVTGKVRGLLCGKCNRGLGCFRDSPTFLLNAVEYLEP
jgi:hypothetical protein